MKHDGEIDISVGLSAKTKVWKNKKTKWSELVQTLSEESKTNETYMDYMSANKEGQLKIKDVGGYVGGYLKNGRRSPKTVVHRQLITLDIDYAHKDFWDDFQIQFDYAAVLHSTHKHHESSPRYRLVLPMSREATPDEYIAVSRKIAGLINIELFDNTTFETNRLMFWPSNPKDVPYYFRFQDGPWVDVDSILGSYTNWTDSSLWPTATRQIENIKNIAEKQEDPENKRGLIGAFCRAYSIDECIASFLPKIYEPCTDGRYTYTKGTTSGGMVVYDGKFAYSHHGTDPCGGKLCNAFDLVRIHKFGHLDPEDSGSGIKSFKAMEEFIRNDKNVKKLIAVENLSEARYDFSEAIDLGEEDLSWMQDLEVNSKGQYLSSAVNINLILANDIRLKGLFKQNNFDGKKYIFGNMPWRKVPRPEPIKNVDLSGVRNYIESIYGITGNMKIEDSIALEFEKNSYHPVQDYLRKLEWDGTERVDTLLIDYFGADDNLYTREAIRKMLVGAVGRILSPGIKFDLVITLVGDQGTGKSTLVKKLGKEWFSDTFLTVQGKEALEQIQGAWLIEMAELSGLRKAEVEAIKHFISKQEDTFRPAYARTSETYLRQCIFVGTTNNKDFLRDPSGNRRFIPVDINPYMAKYDVFTDLTEQVVDQIWAEAVQMFKDREPLFMSKEAEETARIEQMKHSETDERRGIIEEYLSIELPDKWESMDLFERREFIRDPLVQRGGIEREYVCVAEIWCECLGKEKEDMDRYKTRDINDIMKGLDHWEQSRSTKNFGMYGKQKYYSKQIY